MREKTTKLEMLCLDLLQVENPHRDIVSELESLLDEGFTREQALKRIMRG
jgi:hypothetical protein